MKGLGTRLSSGLLGILFLILIVNKGGLFLSTFIFIISLIGLSEFYKAMNNLNLKPSVFVGILSTISIFIAHLLPGITLDFVMTAIIIMFLIFILFKKDSNLADAGITLLGILYVPFLLFHISYLDGTKYIWLIFIIAFGTDTFAYFAGNLFGKRKLWPKISPNKTIEGSIGGILGSLALTMIYSELMNITPIWKLVVLSILTSIISQIGDLVASRIKRITGIKDFGNIIPGHGGIIDRFDSIILTAPVIYYFVRYFL